MTLTEPPSDVDELAASAPTAPATHLSRTARLWHRGRRHPYRSVSILLLAGFVVLTSVSYAQKLAEPGNETVGEKSVEWLRDNHLGPVVNLVENAWYTHNAPPEGGDPRGIDAPASSPAVTEAPSRRVPDHLAPPDALASPAASPVPGEGEWAPTGASVDGVPALYTTQLRPDAVHTSFLVLVAWMDPKLVRFRLHPGVEVPGGSWSTPPSVLDPASDKLLAAFNGGFRMQDAGGGFYADGRQSPPLRDGDATFVVNQDGTADVVQWGRDRTLDGGVAAARQNLALIVDGGQPVPSLDENPGDRWGATVGNKVFVWRSGVGVTADGALVYVGGPSLSAQSLAETLVRAGAVRAMELDINHDWVSFNTYQTVDGHTTGSKALPEMVKPGDRYLSTDSRDFISVSLRDPTAVPDRTSGTSASSSAPKRATSGASAGSSSTHGAPPATSTSSKRGRRPR